MSGSDSPEEIQRLEKEISRIEEAERRRAVSGVILCIPSFNKEEEMKEILPMVLPRFRKVIVCDDGSLDDTASVARKEGAFVMRHDERLGKTKTLSDLMETALQENPEVVVIMEPEGKNDPSSIPELIAPLLRNEADIATVVRETEKLRASSGEFVALNAKAMDARVNEGFYSSIGAGDVQGVAESYNLRFKIVTPRPKLYSPPPAKPEEREHGMRGRFGRAQEAALIRRPFIYVGLTGIELTAAGIGLIILTLYRNNVNGSLDINLAIISAVVLFLGVATLIAYALIFTLQSLFRERAAGKAAEEKGPRGQQEATTRFRDGVDSPAPWILTGL